jgi:hypothetical protein
MARHAAISAIALSIALTGGCAISFRELPLIERTGSGGGSGGGGQDASTTTSSSGSGDSTGGGGSMNGGGGSGGEACGPGPGSVDQTSLDFTGGLDLSNGSPLTQTFTVGKAGVLTGIEVSLASCDHEPEDGSTYLLELRDSGDATLASTSLSAAAFGMNCPPAAPDASMTGDGYFDLSAACVRVKAGDKLKFLLSRVGFANGACAGLCTAGNVGYGCLSNADCDTHSMAAYTSSDSYSGGAVNGSNGDLDFKTFVQ